MGIVDEEGVDDGEERKGGVGVKEQKESRGGFEIKREKNSQMFRRRHILFSLYFNMILLIILYVIRKHCGGLWLFRLRLRIPCSVRAC